MNPIQPLPPMTYRHLQAENEYLKHNLAYTQQVGNYNLSVAQASFTDAQRWRKFKELLDIKQGAGKGAEVEQQIDSALHNVPKSENQSG